MQSPLDRSAHSLSFCCTLSSAGMILTVNPSGAAGLGYAIESLLQTSVFSLFHADDRARLQAAFTSEHADEASDEHSAAALVRLLKSDGSFVEVTATIQMLQGLETIFLLSCSVSSESAPALRQSEKRYRRIVETSNEGIWEIDAEGNTSFVNPRMAAMLGYSMESMLGVSLFAFMDEEWRSIATNNVKRRQQGITEQHDFKFRRRDGSEVWVIISTSPILDEAGQYMGAIATVMDITERKRTEAALQGSEAKLNAILDNAIAVICSFRIFANHDLEYEYFSPRILAVFSYSAEEFMADQKLWRSRVLPEDWETVILPSLDNIFVGRSSTLEYRFRRRDGTVCWICETLASQRDDRRDCWVVTAVSVDITDRKLAEAELQKSEEKFRAIFENAAIGIGLTSLEGQILESNSAWQEMIGYSADELRQMTFREYTHPDYLDLDVTQYARLITGQHNSYQVEKRYICKNGQEFCGRLTVAIVRKANGQPRFTFGMVEDITQRKQIETELRKNEERWQLAIQGSNDGIWDWNIAANENFSSARCSTMLGYENHALGDSVETWRSYIHPDDEARIMTSIQAHLNRETAYYSVEYRARCRDGSYKWIKSHGQAIWDEQGTPLRMVGSQTDISDRKQAEADLQRSEARTRAILAAIPDLIILLNADGIYLEIIRSNTVRDLVPAHINPVGRHLAELVPADHAACEIQAVQRALATGEIQIVEHQVWVSGQLQYEEMRVSPCDEDTAVVMVRDISDRKQAELELKSVNSRLQYLLTATPAAIFSCKPYEDYGANFISENVTTILGYKPQQFTEDPNFWSSNIHPEDKNRILTEVKKISEHNIHTHEFRFRHADGHYCWLYEQLRLVRDETGNPTEMVGYLIDISARKQAEISLQQSEAQFRSIFENAAIGITVSHSPNHNFAQSNLAFQQMLGYSASELATLNYTHITAPEDLLVEQQLIQKVLEEKQNTYTLEKRYLRKDKQTIWVNIIASLIWKENGKLQMAIVMVEDISDRKRSEAALRDSEARFRKVFADAPMGVALVTPEGYIIQANSAFCQILNYSEPELKAQPVRNLIHAEDVEQHLSYTQQLFDREILQYKLEGRLLQPSGESVWVNVSAVLFQESSSETLYKLVMIENITERRTVEQMKDHFVSVVSHELRTPLTSIRGSLGLLATGQVGTLTAEGQEVLNIATSESQRLMRLVSDILDLERLRSGHLSLVDSLCHIPDLVARSVDSVRSLAHESKIEIEVSAVAEMVWADGDRVIQTLTNLLNNAIKFSPSNRKVWVTVRLMAEAIEVPQAPFPVLPGVLFEVKDQGLGIPPDKINVIFEPFEQVDTAASRYKGGSGLGLAICQSIIQGHGGQIWAASILGQGSSFFFTLPFSHSQLSAATSIPNPQR